MVPLITDQCRLYKWLMAMSTVEGGQYIVMIVT